MIGGGAREHALTWKLAQSPRIKEIFAAPGNAGTARLASNIDINPADIEALAGFARENRVDFTLVGPEGPLAAGIVDRFTARGLPVFGPSQKAAEIESSKVFAKELMQKYNIPCARSVSFDDFHRAKEYISLQQPPMVVKADGLAAGKGVIIAGSVDAALKATAQFMEAKTLGSAGSRVIIEEFLPGREMSAFVFTDSKNILPIEPACDYKRVYDGDRGPNTGGMGSYSPPVFLSPALTGNIAKKVMAPVVKAMREEGRPYKGVLYGGLMISGSQVKVLEFNARFGDPETQVIMPRLKTDLMDLIEAVINDRLNSASIEWQTDACVGVVMASGDYPGNYKTGFPITGLDEIDGDAIVFHAGTRTGPGGQVLTSGGRVLTVVATGKTLEQARRKAYANVSRIHFEGCHYRTDIAYFNS